MTVSTHATKKRQRVLALAAHILKKKEAKAAVRADSVRLQQSKRN